MGASFLEDKTIKEVTDLWYGLPALALAFAFTLALAGLLAKCVCFPLQIG